MVTVEQIGQMTTHELLMHHQWLCEKLVRRDVFDRLLDWLEGGSMARSRERVHAELDRRKARGEVQ